MLLGLDVGTTHVKAGVVRSDGSLASVALVRTPVSWPRRGWAEHPVDEVWAALCGVIREALMTSGVHGQEIMAIGVAGMAEAGLLVDAGGTPLTSLLAWYDRRAERIAEEWSGEELAMRVWSTTGLRPSAKVPVVKIQWLTREDPTTLARARRWLHAPDYVAMRLTGEMATSPSLACRTMAFDIEKRSWSSWILEQAGIDEAIWPDVVDSTRPMGALSASASGLLGLPRGIPVVVAGHDHPCGGAAVGVVHEGTALDSLGTAETILKPVRGLVDPSQRVSAYDYGCHVDEGYYMLGGLSAAGGTFEWWVRALVGGTPTGSSDGDVFARALALIQDVVRRPTGILNLPYLQGNGPPLKDHRAAGGIIGLSLQTGTGELLLSALEGLACESRRMLDGMGQPVPQALHAIGGGARNGAWLQVKANVLGLPIIVSPVREAVLQGAALAAGVAAGAFTDLAEARASISGTPVVIEPESRRVQAYGTWYREVFQPAAVRHREIDADRQAWSKANEP